MSININCRPSDGSLTSTVMCRRNVCTTQLRPDGRPVASLLMTVVGRCLSDFRLFSGFENWSTQWLSRGHLDF